jgi:hypothetical protein
VLVARETLSLELCAPFDEGVCLRCTEVATDGACSAGKLCDRVNDPVMPPEMMLTNIAMPMPMFVSRLTSQ